MLKLDYTLLIQIANFLILLFILNIVLYRPIRRILARRKGEMETFEKMIGDFQEKSVQNEKELEEGRIGARKDGFIEKESLRTEGVEQEKWLVQEAISSATEKISLAKQDIEKQMATVSRSLESDAVDFSREVAEKILGRAIDG